MPHNVILPQFLAALLLVTSTVVWQRGGPSLRSLRKRFEEWLRSLRPPRRPRRIEVTGMRGARSWLD